MGLATVKAKFTEKELKNAIIELF